jgi:hypothetical protein
MLGPDDVSIDSPPGPTAPPTTGLPLPRLPITIPNVNVHVSPKDAAPAGGVLATMGGIIAILGKAGSTIVHPFGP